MVWGKGQVLREFLHAKPMLSHINVGTGVNCSIKELAESKASVVDFDGTIVWDSNNPDGPPKKLMDSTLLVSLDWQPKYDLLVGLKDTYEYFKANVIREFIYRSIILKNIH